MAVVSLLILSLFRSIVPWIKKYGTNPITGEVSNDGYIHMISLLSLSSVFYLMCGRKKCLNESKRSWMRVSFWSMIFMRSTLLKLVYRFIRDLFIALKKRRLLDLRPSILSVSSCSWSFEAENNQPRAVCVEERGKCVLFFFALDCQ